MTPPCKRCGSPNTRRLPAGGGWFITCDPCGHATPEPVQEATPDAELVERLCDFHKRLLLCFEGATGERPPARPRPFEPEWQDTETLLDAASFVATPVQEATRTVGDAE